MGMIAIDREGGAGALRRMLAEARQTLEAGKHIIIFPEGTRTEPGQRRPYHPGVAALYKQLGVPVLPVALNSGLFWPARSFRQKPGRITVRLLPPLPPGLGRREFTDRLERAIEDASRSLLPDHGRRVGKPVDNSVGET